jgi:hypothetical protein
MKTSDTFLELLQLQTFCTSFRLISCVVTSQKDKPYLFADARRFAGTRGVPHAGGAA